MSPYDPVVEAARRVLTGRRRRGRFLPADLLGEPAWDILLDLLVSAADGVPVPLKSACIAADVPPTTAMRYVDALAARGLVGCAPDPRDRRRKLLVLTEEGGRATRAAITELDEASARAAGETTAGTDPHAAPRGAHARCIIFERGRGPSCLTDASS